MGESRAKLALAAAFVIGILACCSPPAHAPQPATHRAPPAQASAPLPSSASSSERNSSAARVMEYAPRAGAASAQEEADRLDRCGYTFPVASYVARVAGLDIALTANDRLLVDGRVLAERNPWRRNEPPSSWYDSANTAEIALGRHEYVVRTSSTDCIDYESTTIYVINERGILRAAFSYPKMWERVLLSYRATDIVYATNYYCEFVEGAPQGQVWIHVLRAGASEFVREARPRAEVCAENEARAAGQLLVFMPMQPVLPARD